VIVSAAAGSRTMDLEQWWVASNWWEKSQACRQNSSAFSTAVISRDG